MCSQHFGCPRFLTHLLEASQVTLDMSTEVTGVSATVIPNISHQGLLNLPRETHRKRARQEIKVFNPGGCKDRKVVEESPARGGMRLDGPNVTASRAWFWVSKVEEARQKCRKQGET